ncbi:potassium channel family protein [Microbacterium sp. SLBN-146]|uniref:potassium channel family protein n=1 Tax=Microbacterium sp. SLBN-146 TaxID=2768457 RepID=UPI00114E8BA1|nr:potassium channel family protein [Microbacterium sp. SLBN-146]TQJ30248.1 voltage-gated potassium channel [Microbacterium sp. SLBN-146]
MTDETPAPVRDESQPQRTMKPGETAATHRWSSAMYWPLTIAALLFLITYTIHVVGNVRGPFAGLTTAIIAFTWIMFVVDYLVRLALSRPRGAWFRAHLVSLGMVLVPALRPVRLLDASTRLAAFRRSAGSTLRARLLIYGVGSALLLIWYISLVVLQFERDAPGASIDSFGDAVWWAFCTVTTVGYGDFVPVTIPGRTAAVVLMAGGVVLVGLIVATISSSVVERVAQAPSVPVPLVPRRGASRSAPENVETGDAP